MAGMTTLYLTANTFFEMLLETAEFIEKAKLDDSINKEEVLRSMETRVGMLVGKMAAHPSCTSFAILRNPDNRVDAWKDA